MARLVPEVVVLTIRLPPTETNQPDGFQRLRKLLKTLGRVYGLKVESIEPLNNSPTFNTLPPSKEN